MRLDAPHRSHFLIATHTQQDAAPRRTPRRMDATFRRFSVFYLCYYAALGAYTPYIGRWVASLGHGGYVVGAMLGLWYASRIVGPPAWIAASHRSPRQGRWFVAGCVLTLLCFAGFVFTRSAWSLLAVMA